MSLAVGLLQLAGMKRSESGAELSVPFGFHLMDIELTFLQSGELYHTFSGHFEEVTGLLLMGSTVVSISIDATIRQWSLRPQDLTASREEAQAAKSGEIEEKHEPVKDSVLTEDEERELAELMEEE